jgi:putative PIN family toxin of toxin-antitoxin system
MSLRVVFDTSTLVSAALRPDSNPNRALQTALLSHHVWVSAETLDELERVLRREKFDRYMKLESRVEFVERVRRDCVHCVVPSEVFAGARGVCRDANDDQFLALCAAAHADILVSSDNDLLVLHPWRGTPILTPAQFVHQFRQ